MQRLKNSKEIGVLIDTSVWIEFFRNRDTDLVNMVKRLIKSNRAYLCGVLLSELLQGIKNQRGRMTVKKALHGLPYIEMDIERWEEAGNISLGLRKKGHLIPLTDIFVAVLAIHYNLEVFTLDVHFQLIPGISLFKGQP